MKVTHHAATGKPLAVCAIYLEVTPLELDVIRAMTGLARDAHFNNDEAYDASAEIYNVLTDFTHAHLKRDMFDDTMVWDASYMEVS
jgi:hypothetical protein